MRHERSETGREREQVDRCRLERFPHQDGQVRVGPVVEHAIALSRHPGRARFCFSGTALDDDPDWEHEARSALVGAGVQFSAPRLTHPGDLQELRELLTEQDVIWANGGSGARLLEVWHRLDLGDVLREAWDRGTVMAGISAGAICWHVGGTPDWGDEPRAEAILDGLGLVPFETGVHYQDERRPVLHELVANQVLPVSYATDDGVALVYQDDHLFEAVADTPDANAYRVSRNPDGSIEEAVITPRLLNERPGARLPFR